MQRARVLLLVSLVLLPLLAVLVMQPANASAQSNNSPLPDRRLQIYPVRKQVEAAAGSAYQGAVNIRNTGKKELVVQLSAQSFEVTDEQYDYKFLPDSPKNNWVYFATSTITLAPNQNYLAKYLINVPVDAEPGGVYYSIFAASEPVQDAAIESVDRVGSLIYLTVPGNVTRLGQLIKFNVPSFVVSTLPWSTTVRNAGSVHYETSYTVSLKDIFGNDVSQNRAATLLFPRSVRLINGSLDPPRWLGVYKVGYSFTLGQNAPAIGRQFIVYAPLTQLIPAIALIAAALIGVISLIRKHRTRKLKND